MDVSKLPSKIRDYEILNKIGAGRYGTAFRVYSHRYHCEFCLKVISSNESTSDQLTQYLFKKEAETLRLVGHVYVIRLYDYFQEGDYYYLVTEYCSHDTLAHALETSGAMDLPTIRVVFRQILEAICFIHSLNIVHRDIKPANIAFDGLDRPKILDWGYSTLVKDGQLLNTFCGSFPYVSPECVSKVPYDGKMCDIWALGVTLFYMAFKKSPWEGKHQNEQVTNLLHADFCVPPTDPALADLIRRMIRVQPEQRITANEALKHEFFRATCPPILKPRSISARPRMLIPKYSSAMNDKNANQISSNRYFSKRARSIVGMRIPHPANI